MTIGNVIIELRSEHNLSQKKLADAIGISQSAIAQIELNRNEATASTIRKLSEYFQVSTDFLLNMDDNIGVRTTDAMHDAYTSEEREIIAKYRRLPDKIKKLVRDQLEVYGERSELLPDKNKKV